eukprot:PhF_6_TR821/c1_g1_i1/m.1248
MVKMPLISAYFQGKIQDHETMVLPLADGLFNMTPHGVELMKRLPWTQVAPKALARVSQFNDVLPPRQQLLMKIVSCISKGDVPCPVTIAMDITMTFFTTARETLVVDVRVLGELLLLDVNGDMCKPRTLLLEDAVFRQLTPRQVTVVARKVALIFETSSWYRTGAINDAHLATLW